jgi:hypothetical protein
VVEAAADLGRGAGPSAITEIVTAMREVWTASPGAVSSMIEFADQSDAFGDGPTPPREQGLNNQLITPKITDSETAAVDGYVTRTRLMAMSQNADVEGEQFLLNGTGFSM